MLVAANPGEYKFDGFLYQHLKRFRGSKHSRPSSVAEPRVVAKDLRGMTTTAPRGWRGGSMWLGALLVIATLAELSDSAGIPLRHGAAPVEQPACRRPRNVRFGDLAMVRTYDFTTKATNSLKSGADEQPPL
jgi:hypothetical protein